MRIDGSSLHPLTVLMLYGLQLEKRDGILVGTFLRKPFKHDEFWEVSSWLHLYDVVVSVPYGDQCVHKTVVFEFWAPSIPEPVLSEWLRRRVVLTPGKRYVQSFDGIVEEIARLARGADEVKVYVTSKYARPGYVYAFAERLRTRNMHIYIATSTNQRIKRMDKTVHLVYTASHRKLILVAARRGRYWHVTGYHGSMNLFFPGVDDYMLAANDFYDLQAVVHGLIRSFLVL